MLAGCAQVAAIAPGPAHPDAKSSNAAQQSPNDLFRGLARAAPRGAYPRYYQGEQTTWTAIGPDGGPRQALLSSDGLLEVDQRSFSVEPFLRVDGRLVTWADATIVPSLAAGALPIPSVEWSIADAVALTLTRLCDAGGCPVGALCARESRRRGARSRALARAAPVPGESALAVVERRGRLQPDPRDRARRPRGVAERREGGRAAAGAGCIRRRRLRRGRRRAASRRRPGAPADARLRRRGLRVGRVAASLRTRTGRRRGSRDRGALRRSAPVPRRAPARRRGSRARRRGARRDAAALACAARGASRSSFHPRPATSWRRCARRSARSSSHATARCCGPARAPMRAPGSATAR